MMRFLLRRNDNRRLFMKINKFEGVGFQSKFQQKKVFLSCRPKETSHTRKLFQPVNHDAISPHVEITIADCFLL